MFLQPKTKRLFIPILFGLLLGSFFVSPVVLAQYGLEYGTLTGLGTADLRITIMNVIRVILGFLGVLAIALLVYAGFVWMTAGGNAERVERAKKIIINTVIGLVIIMLSFAITSFIINQLAEATGAANQRCEFGVDLPQACSTNLAGCPGQRTCQASNVWGPCTPTNLGDPRCQPSALECRVRSITPNGDNRGLGYPMNSVVRARLNQGGITNVDATTFVVTELDIMDNPVGPVSGTINVGAGVVTFVPLADCAAPWEAYKCFKADTKYQVALTAGQVQCGGRDLVCGVNSQCVITFITGDFIDAEIPTVSLIDTQICQSTGNQLKAVVNDDYGVAEAIFTNINNNTEIGVDTNITVPPAEIASIVWDTSAYPVNSVVDVQAQVNDFDSNTNFNSRPYEIRAAHCCDNQKNADETDVDCGGLDCEACVPTIEWVLPSAGAPGNLITIHGRHFGAYSPVSSQVAFSDANVPAQTTVLARLANEVNPACSDFWSDQEVIAEVPSAAEDGPIKITRFDGLTDQTDDNRGWVMSFDVNSTVLPGLCTLSPNVGLVNDPISLQGVRFTPALSLVYFGAEKAGGIANVVGTTQITGVSVPNIPDSEVSVRVAVSDEYSNPKSFIVGLEAPGPEIFACSSNPLACAPDQAKCNPNQFCNNSCECEPRLACDSDNFTTPSCEPNQGSCPGGWFCYSSLVNTPDPNKTDCYCYQAEACDNPTFPASAINPACHPDSGLCPTGYICDPLSNCTCQSATGIPNNSTYAYSFQTGIKPGPCSADAGLCLPDDDLCSINEVCNLDTCFCQPITPSQSCDLDPSTPACEQNNLACDPDEFCDTDCFCKPTPPPGIPCDDNLAEPACQVNNNLCPQDYTCDPASCFCQPLTGIPNNSTYAYSFQTGIKPGPCSVDAGLCLPDDELCSINEVCNLDTCFCQPITPPQSCDGDPSNFRYVCRGGANLDEFCDNGTGGGDLGLCPDSSSGTSCVPDNNFPICDPNNLLCKSDQICATDCTCQPKPPAGIPCDEDLLTPACQANDTMCPDDYTCNPSTCFCQPAVGIPENSTYAYFFSTATFGPQVVENCNRTQSCVQGLISSPTPYDKAGTVAAGYRVGPQRRSDGGVPIDSIVSAMFTTPMYRPSISSATVQVYRCNSAVAVFDAGSCESVTGTVTVYACGQDQDCFDFNPDSLLIRNYWYQVVLTASNIFGANGVNLVGNQSNQSGGGFYSWAFKTRDSDALSQVGCVYVQPPEQTSYVYNDNKNWTAQAVPQDFVCVVMDPNSCDWGWRTNETAPVRAEITGSVNTAVSTAKIQTIPDPPVDIVAACTIPAQGTVEGQADLIIDFTTPYVTDRFPDCGTACLNALIGATFSLPMDNNSVTNAIELYLCNYSDPTCSLSQAERVPTFHKPISTNPAEAPNTYTGYTDCFDFNDDDEFDYCLLPNNYYRVVITNQAVSRDEGRSLGGLNFDASDNGTDRADAYSWVFKTQKDFGLCNPGDIDVIPEEKFSPVNKKIQYSARPKTSPDSCDPEFGQRLNPYSWNWGWDTDLISEQHLPLCTGAAIADFFSADSAGVSANYYCGDPTTRHLRDSCGNGILEEGEDCDDGNAASSDGCSGVDSTEPCVHEGSNSTYGSTCGNGLIEKGEDCDDGNAASSDGCSGPIATQPCTWEGNSGYVCLGTTNQCDPGEPTACADTPADCIQLQICGNGFMERTEQCDPPGPGCSSQCLLTGSAVGVSLCGDAIVGPGEECDLGDLGYRHCSQDYSVLCGGFSCDGGSRDNLSCSRADNSLCNSGVCNFNSVSGTFICVGGSNAGDDCTAANGALCPGGSCQSNASACSALGTCVATPQNDDGDNCSDNCLIEDDSISLCRSDSTNRFSFARLPANADCDIDDDCADGESCVALNSVTGNSNQGAVCGNSVIEYGEECDFGGVCSDSGAACTSYNLSGCDDPATATCQPEAVPGCSEQCLHTGSFQEITGPPLVGPYQIAQTLADGETYIQSWITSFTPPNGPLGEGFLNVGGGLNFRVIDWWPDCATACLNSAAGGQFNRTPDSATLPPNAENISFYECADTTCPLSTAEALTRGADFSVIYRTENPELDNDVFEIELLSGYGNFISGVPALKPNTTYRVVVDRAVRSTDDEVLTGLNFDINDDDTNDFFSWTFTTQQSATLCQLEEVSVAPVRATLEEDGHRMSYFAQAWAYNDQCGDIRLNSYQYNWGWDDFNVDGVDAVNFVTQAGQLQDGCGNGRVEFGEDCDYNDPRLINPLLCSNSCKWIGSAVCPSAPIIPNSNFVLDVSPADGKPDDWLVEPVGNGTLAAEAVVAHPGSDGRSAKVTINSLADWGAQLVSRTAALASIPSGDYVLTAWVKTNITASSTKVIISNQGTEWTDGTDKVWPAWASYHPDQPCKFNLTSDSWTRLTCPFTIPPAGATTAPVQFQIRVGSSGIFYVDDVNLAIVGGGQCCGNGLIERGEQCEDSVNGTVCGTTGLVCNPANPSSCPNGTCYDYCSPQCLLTGNNNQNPVCGNGLVEENEMCDLGNNGQGNDSDGCTDTCRYAGSPSLPNVQSLCGDGQIGFGEECDGGSNCTSGSEAYCTGYSNSSSCSNDPRCYWTGSSDPTQDCLPRPCVLTDASRTIDICKANATTTVRLAVDFNQDSDNCNLNYSQVNLSILNGNSALRQSACGNRTVEPGEQCDDGGQCQTAVGEWISCTIFDQSRCALTSPCLPRAGYWPTNGDACPLGATQNGTCTNNFCVVGGINSGSYCTGSGSCTITCLSDGCGQSCTFNSSVAFDGRIDPTQVVQSLPLSINLPTVREAIYAWHTLQPERAGRGDLTVYIKPEVPFAIVGHQPLHDPAADNRQCRNVALWAIFSREVDLTTLRTCQVSGTYCSGDIDCPAGDSCVFSNISLQACPSGVCPADLTEDNYIRSLEHDILQGQCINNRCQFPLADFENTPYLDSFCRLSIDCRASQVSLTGIKGHCAGSGLAEPCTTFRQCNETSGTDFGFCEDNGQLCTATDKTSCGNPTAVCRYDCLDIGVLAADTSYQLTVRDGDDGVKSAVGESGENTLNCNETSLRCDWRFSTSDNFCQCSYLSVNINPTSAGSDTVSDFFSCAGDSCGQNTEENPLDDDAADGIPVTEANYSGNQHHYRAQCWDISYSPRVPINDGMVRYSWLPPRDPDKIIYLSQTDSGADPGRVVSPDQNLKDIYVTPGTVDTQGTPNPADDLTTPAGKNGLAYVDVEAREYKCVGTGILCSPDPAGLDPRGSCVFGTGPCVLQFSANQQVEVTNFICDNPWPDNPVYEDFISNTVAPDTNFKLYYCQDDGAAGFSDDLPSLPIPNSVRTVRPGPAGTDLIKDLIFPLCQTSEECDGQVASNLASGKGLGIQVRENPLHLSPATWYRSGLCGGVSSFANLCFSDSDCGELSDQNLAAFWSFDEGFGTTVADRSGNNNHGLAATDASTPEWVSGKVFKALRFDSPADYVEVNDTAASSLDLASDFTISAWVNFELPLGEVGSNIIEKFGSYGLRLWNDLDTNTQVSFYIFPSDLSGWALFNTTLDSASALQPGRWYHLAAAYNRQPGHGQTTMKVYVDGKEISGNLASPNKSCDDNSDGSIQITEVTSCLTDTDCDTGISCLPYVPESIAVTNDYLRIAKHGIEPDTDQYNFKGLIDEVRLYSRALPGQEIIDLAQARGSSTCQLNVPNNDQGRPQTILVDGYEAVKDQRTVYAGATNRAGSGLFSNIYLISHDQNADPETVEIFNRLLDPNQQQGVWSFNANFTNVRVCSQIGYFAGTTNVCNLTNVTNDVLPKYYSEACRQYTGLTGKAACNRDLVNGCYWLDEANTCLARVCEPISCRSDFECPNLNCYANKEKVVRDAKRYGDLRDNQITLALNYNEFGSYPDLAGGTYIPATTFSAWPSWDQTLARSLQTTLSTDPINLFYQCPGGYICDSNGNGEIDGLEDTSCNYIIDPANCANQCLPADPDQGLTCWDDVLRQFSCPTVKFCDDDESGSIEIGEITACASDAECGVGTCLPYKIQLYNYAYHYLDEGAGQYEMFTNFEYGGSGNWRTRPVSLGGPLYQLPITSVNPATGEGGVCRPFNFEVHEANISGGAVASDCDAYGGDPDLDGVCDDEDNCSGSRCVDLGLLVQDCYNPDQQDSDSNNIGNVCDFTCAGDADKDSRCDEIDNCRTISNPDQFDRDLDGYGDVCDPCTDIDHDSLWDVNTGANVEGAPLNCHRDTAPVGYCSSGLSPDYGCWQDNQCQSGSCDFDPFFATNPIYSSLTERGFLSSDHFGFCTDATGNPLRNQICCLDYNQAGWSPDGQYSSGTCQNGGGSIPLCSSCGGADFGTYNPYQEDFDGPSGLGDLVGYIIDDCLDFDSDNFGDYSFYSRSSNPATAFNLAPSQKEHFRGCALNQSSFVSWGSEPVKNACRLGPALVNDNFNDDDNIGWQLSTASGGQATLGWPENRLSLLITDNVGFGAAVVSKPVVTNSGFEAPISGSGWWAEPAGNSVVQNNQQLRPGSLGTYSALVNISALDPWGGQLTFRADPSPSAQQPKNLPGGQYLVSAWIRQGAPAPGAESRPIEVIVANTGSDWADGDGNTWGPWVWYSQSCQTDPTILNQWQLVTCPVVIPPAINPNNEAPIQIQFRTPSVLTFQVDDVNLERAFPAGDYTLTANVFDPGFPITINNTNFETPVNVCSNDPGVVCDPIGFNGLEDCGEVGATCQPQPKFWGIDGFGKVDPDSSNIRPGSADNRSAKVTVNDIATWGGTQLSSRNLVGGAVDEAWLPSGDYILSAWIKSEIFSKPLEIAVSNRGINGWTDNNGRHWDAFEYYSPGCKTSVAVSGWQRVSCLVNIPPAGIGDAPVQFFIRAFTDGVFYVDDVTLDRVNFFIGVANPGPVEWLDATGQRWPVNSYYNPICRSQVEVTSGSGFRTVDCVEDSFYPNCYGKVVNGWQASLSCPIVIPSAVGDSHSAPGQIRFLSRYDAGSLEIDSVTLNKTLGANCCGNGIVEPAVGESCDDNTASCDQTCHQVTIYPPSCADSDGPDVNPDVAGVVVVYQNNQRTNYPDICAGDNLVEYTCPGGSAASNFLLCSTVRPGTRCLNGACVPISCGNGTCEVGEVCSSDCDNELGDTPTEPPATNNYCHDGADNDQNSCVDSLDAQCGGTEDFCQDGRDNDCDGDFDCWDTADCSSDPSCAEICNDGADNDGDSFVDCQDFSCLGQTNSAGLICCGNIAIGDGLGADYLDSAVCGGCEFCQNVASSGHRLCMPSTALDGRPGGSCLSACTQCVSGACVSYPEGDHGECTETNYVCQAGTCQFDPIPPSAVAITYIGGVPIGSLGTVSGWPVVVVFASDNLVVSSVELFIDAVAVGTDTVADGVIDFRYMFSIDWNTNSHANGPHIITAVARDGAGNQGTSAPVNVTVQNLEVCTNNTDDDGDGLIDCQDIDSCLGQVGPDGHNKCCWDGNYNADPDSNAYCDTCQRCRTPGDIGSALPNDYQCRDVVSDEGVGCLGTCTLCLAGGLCQNRTATTGLEAECTNSCTSCSDGSGGTCLAYYEGAQDPVAPAQCLSPQVCTAGSCGTGVVTDTIPPAAIDDLSLTNFQTNAITLNWTAVGDDGNTGTAASYEVRYSTSLITAANWTAATLVASGVPLPAAPGSPQSMIVSGLNPNTVYYLGIKTADEVPNQSALSNIPSGTTLVSALYCDEDDDSHFNTTSSPNCPSGRQAGDSGNDCNDGNLNIYGGNANAFCDCDAGDGSDQGITEVCDGADNDCDGTVDDGCGGQCTPPASRNCGASPLNYQGVCAANTASCTVGGSWSTADCEVGKLASDITCNNIDEDCSGVADEDYPSSPTTCGVGACAASGSSTCISGTVQNTCTPGTPAVNDASCNGIDDDCNGSTDEDYASTPTTCGQGVCARTGTLSCVSGTEQDSCTPGTGSTEICDSLDNDCDGSTDEGCGTECLATDAPLRCDQAPLDYAGVCGVNLADCVSGTWDRTDCTKGGNYQSIETSCTDDLDNDCDNLADCQDTFNCPASSVCSGNCVTATCSAAPSYNWVCAPDASVNCGQCGTCALSSPNNYNCQANPAACEVTATGACYECGLTGPPFTCQIKCSGQDTSGLYQCSNLQSSTVGDDLCGSVPCKCAVGGVCVPDLPDSDFDGLPDVADACPYDPNDDLDNDGTCAVGCTSGSGRIGSKTNGWVCAATSSVSRDTCQGSSCGQANSCKAIFGAEDYFNVYINGKLVVGNLYVPRYQSYNLPASVIDTVNFNIDDYLVSGENVIAFEAFDTNPNLTLAPKHSPIGSNRELLGVFADFNDSGLCAEALLPLGNRKQTSYVAVEGPFPTKCYAIINGIGTLPDSSWKLPGFTETAAWTNAVSGSAYGLGLSEIDDRLRNNNNYQKYNDEGASELVDFSPRPIWHQISSYNTSYIFCRATFIR